jgi:hypothetical protein
VQVFSGLEAHRLAGGDADFSAGAGVAADACFACADAENSESAQFDALACCESLFEALENRIHSSFGLAAGKARALDYVMDDVLLNQWGNLAGATLKTVLRLTVEMLQVSAWEAKSRYADGWAGKGNFALGGVEESSICQLRAGFLMMNFHIAQKRRSTIRERDQLRITESYVDSERPVDQGTGTETPHDRTLQ